MCMYVGFVHFCDAVWESAGAFDFCVCGQDSRLNVCLCAGFVRCCDVVQGMHRVKNHWTRCTGGIFQYRKSVCEPLCVFVCVVCSCMVVCVCGFYAFLCLCACVCVYVCAYVCACVRACVCL